MTAAPRPGPLALVGGAAWTEGCSFDEELWQASGRSQVLVVPTGAAYEHPQREVDAAAAWLGAMGAEVRGLMVLSRGDAEDPAKVAEVRAARYLYLTGGSPLHLRSVLKDSAVWRALVAAWHDGAVVAAASGGAMVLGDPMVDPRGGALTLGLGLVSGVAVLCHSSSWSPDKAQRTVSLATGHLRIAAVDDRTALIRRPDGSWDVAGAGRVEVYVDGGLAHPDALKGVGIAELPDP